MIESITLANFRRFERVTVDFQPHPVTVLSGKSSAGKSTIIRALRWVAFNKPGGDGVLRWGADFVWTRLNVDGRQVVRKRGGAAGNLYKLDGALYKSFGAEPPDDVARLLNVSPLLNFSGQHSAPFLFHLTPGEAARQLNAVVNLDAIDEALASSASEVRRTKSATVAAEERMNHAQERARATEWVEGLHRTLARAEEAQREHEAVQVELEAAEALLERTRSLALQRKQAAHDLEQLAGVTDELDQLVAKCERLSARAAVAGRLLARASAAEQMLSVSRKELTEAEAEMAELDASRCPLCGRGDR